MFPRQDFAHDAHCILAPSARRIALIGVDDVDQVVRDLGAELGAGLGGADVHAAVHQRGIDADDLGIELLCQGEGGGALAGRGGSGQRHDGGRRSGGHRVEGSR